MWTSNRGVSSLKMRPLPLSFVHCDGCGSRAIIKSDRVADWTDIHLTDCCQPRMSIQHQGGWKP